MNTKAALLAVVTGFAGFMLATVAVTELLQPTIEFSILVGLPVGILVGILTTWFVYTRQRHSPGVTDGQRVSSALVGAAVGFVVVLALVVTFRGGTTFGILAATAAAVLAGVLMYLRGPETL